MLRVGGRPVATVVGHPVAEVVDRPVVVVVDRPVVVVVVVDHPVVVVVVDRPVAVVGDRPEVVLARTLGVSTEEWFGTGLVRNRPGGLDGLLSVSVMFVVKVAFDRYTIAFLEGYLLRISAFEACLPLFVNSVICAASPLLFLV